MPRKYFDAMMMPLKMYPIIAPASLGRYTPILRAHNNALAAMALKSSGRYGLDAFDAR